MTAKLEREEHTTGTTAEARPTGKPAQETGGVRRIVVPLDGSRFAREALAPAQQLARSLGAEIVLIQAVVPAPVPDVDSSLALQLGETDARRSLREAASRLRAAGSTVSEVLVTGTLAEHPSEAIVTTVREFEGDLVVMATHGRTGLGRALLGSVADAVVRQSRVPVLLIHPQADASGAPAVPTAGGSVRRADEADEADEADGPAAIGVGTIAPQPHVVVALDGSPEAEAVLEPAIALARALHAHAELVRAIVAIAPAAANAAPPTAEAAKVYLQTVARRLVAGGCPAQSVSTTLLPIRDTSQVAGALVSHAARQHGAVLALATHARQGVARLLRGSVGSAVVAQTPVPVLIVRTAA